MTPVVSVVIAAYNASRYIGEAVASVLGQTMSALEVIVVDDGSSDDTAGIVGRIADPRVHLLRQSNGGPAAARNHGIQSARARRFIAFLDADDHWDAGKLARQIECLDARPGAVVAGSLMRYISSTGRVLGRCGQTVTSENHDAIAAGELFPFPLSSFLIRREALATAGGFDDRLAGAEDIDLLARLALAGDVTCVPAILGSYRIHPSSAMARHRASINRDARFVRQRLAARRRGGDLTWNEFVRSHDDSWRERRQRYAEICYRAAALWYAEGRTLKALAYGSLAAAINPRYTFRRVYVQRLAGGEVAAETGETR
jgi:glycosyltransferase involved in cell wall biosynthesis